MIYKIKSNTLTAEISEFGAELKSLKIEDNNEEYIWCGDPKFWKGTAPILFPIIGRLKNNEYMYKKKKYQMPKHGILRTRRFNLNMINESKLQLETFSDIETKDSYPFEFKFQATFTVQDNHLKVDYHVINTDRNKIYFCLGSHPAFSLPLDNCKLADYYLEFESNENLDRYLLDNGLLDLNPIKSYINNEKKIQLSDNLFINDALIFKNIKSRKIYLKNKQNGLRFIFDTGGAPNLGIWSKPGAPFVCLEPWYGHDDFVDTHSEFIAKDNIIELAPNHEFSTGYHIII